MSFHRYYRPFEFSFYDIACAALAALPIILIDMAVTAGIVWVIGGLI